MSEQVDTFGMSPQNGDETRVATGDVRTDGGEPTIADAFDAYRDECACGEHLDNNCAHYLSDAFIRAGFDELDGGDGAHQRKHDGRLVCSAGRPIRAREMREWFQENATDTHEGEPDNSQYWAVFQLDDGPDRYWGGHVVIHNHDGEEYDSVGTGDYPDWASQEHYTW